jgi:GT2 family glycosyltransferase
MKPIPVLGIPHYNRPDLLARCVGSIDYPVDKLVIIVNGSEDPMAEITSALFKKNKTFIKEPIIIRHPNAGVAGSWNEVIKLFPAPFWMLANNDIQFAPGDLEKMAQAAWLNSHEAAQQRRPTDVAPMAMLYGNHGASWFVITRHGVQSVGLYDENFYPAYLEDCDWSRRAVLAGARMLNVEGLKAIHGTATDAADQTKGSCTIHSDPRLAEANMRTHGRNFEYYRAKWGGINGEEKFKTPFHDPNWPLWAWKFEPGMRERQQEDWDKETGGAAAPPYQK